jgi:zinc transport system ATP-binding protein
MKPLVAEVSHVDFHYRGEPVLEKASLSLRQGEFVGIIGPNGGGKTTLLKLLMGFLRPSSGSIRLFGDDPFYMRTRIGYVPQVHRIDRDFPITLQELVYQGALSKIPRLGPIPASIVTRAAELIDQLELVPHQNKPIGSLSGGLAQRALLARALLSYPDLLLLDEPTANIDPTSKASIQRLLQRLKERTTIAMVTHDLEPTLRQFDRVLVVQKTVRSMPTHEICEHFALGLYHGPLKEERLTI